MKPRPDAQQPQQRVVTCPTCGGPSLYASSNAYRPFCSVRCRQLDLGAWASEQFVLPTQTPPEPDPALSR